MISRHDRFINWLQNLWICHTLQTGHVVPFLTLSSCYKTQSNLPYSGLNTLAIILNSLQIDPRSKWKSIWQWYPDELLDDCFYRDGVKRPGTILEGFVYLAECNGAVAIIERSNNSIGHFEKFVQNFERVCTEGRQASDKNYNDEIPTE